LLKVWLVMRNVAVRRRRSGAFLVAGVVAWLVGPVSTVQAQPEPTHVTAPAVFTAAAAPAPVIAAETAAPAATRALEAPAAPAQRRLRRVDGAELTTAMMLASAQIIKKHHAARVG
jgi:hypothetical protein